MKPTWKFLLLGMFFLTFACNSVFAQVDPNAPTATPVPPTATPTPPIQRPQATDTPVPAGNSNPATSPGPVTPHEQVANCDACGYCNGMTLEQVPDRWQSCRTCIYPSLAAGEMNPLDNKSLIAVPTPDQYHIYTDFGCLSSEPGAFASQISSFFFSLVGGIAFLFFIYGAGVVATSRSDPGRLNKGRRIIYGAIVGLLFALFSVFLLRFIVSGIGASL